MYLNWNVELKSINLQEGWWKLLLTAGSAARKRRNKLESICGGRLLDVAKILPIIDEVPSVSFPYLISKGGSLRPFSTGVFYWHSSGWVVDRPESACESSTKLINKLGGDWWFIHLTEQLNCVADQLVEDCTKRMQIAARDRRRKQSLFLRKIRMCVYEIWVGYLNCALNKWSKGSSSRSGKYSAKPCRSFYVRHFLDIHGHRVSSLPYDLPMQKW